MRLLIYLHPEGEGAEAQQYTLPLNGGQLILGRGPESPIPLDGTKISRNHLAFTFDHGELAVTDLSSNGVWINGDPAPRNTSVRVTILDEITIPGYKMYANIEEQAGPGPVAAPAAQATAVLPSAGISPAPAPAEPSIWKPNGLEKVVLILLLLAAALVAYYYSLQ